MIEKGSTRMRISLFGNFGTLNIGNECTLQAIILNIRKFLPEADINCICSIPEDVLARHGISAFPISLRSKGVLHRRVHHRPKLIFSNTLRGLILRFSDELRDLARIKEIIKGRDLLIMTGTGMLSDNREGPLGLHYEILKWTLIAKFCRLRVFFVSVGASALRYRLSRWLIKSSLTIADYVCFRDLQSQQCMADLGFHRRSVVFPDLAFSLPQTLSPTHPRSTASKPVIGVGLYDYCARGMNSESDRRSYQGYLKKIGDFIEWLVNRNYPVRVLIGDIAYDTAVREDLRKSIEERGMNYSRHHIIDEPIASISDLFGQIGSTDIVVASRFHNIIISLILAKPVIGISYHKKISSLMAETGLPEYCLNIEDFEVAGLIERLAAIENHIQEILLRIREGTQKYHKALDKQYRLILSMLMKKTKVSRSR
jgi:polysaccharide pyruvyl transferase WcaK-like protein